MAQLFNHNQSFRWQPAVVDLKDHMVLSGQIHEKSTLASLPFKMLDFNTYDKKYLIGKHSWVYENDGQYDMMGTAALAGGETYTQFIVDESDSSVGYLVCPRDDGTSLRVHKINTDTHEILGSGATSMGSSGDRYSGYDDYPGNAIIVWQDADYIYALHKERGTRVYNNNYSKRPVGRPRLIWINKSDLTVGGEQSANYHNNATFIGRYGTDLYWASVEGAYNGTSYDTYNKAYVYRFQTGTKTSEELTNRTAPASAATSHSSNGVCSRFFSEGPDIMYGYWTTRSDLSEEGYLIYKMECNMLAGTAAISEVTFDFGTTDRETTLIRTDVSNLSSDVVTFTMDDGSNKYVNFVITEAPENNNQTLDCFKVHTFQINSGNRSNLIYKSTINPGFRIRGIMPLLDNYTKFMLIGDSHCEVWTWNDSTEEYTYTSQINLQVHGACLDTLNRLWILDNNNDVHLNSNFSPVTITVNPELASYNYAGSDINTYINVSAYDIDNQRLATNVRIVLEGAVAFTDNSTIKTITTSAADETQVNIKITGTSFTKVLTSVVV